MKKVQDENQEIKFGLKTYFVVVVRHTNYLFV